MTHNQPDAQQIVDELRQLGERVTIQRRMVIEALCKAADHQTVYDVWQYLKERGEDLPESTVYRILRWLNEQGFASQTDLGIQGIVYELNHGDPHHHLVCLSCGQITQFDDPYMDELANHLRQEYGFEPRVEHMAFFGWCKECQKRNLTGTFAHGE